MILGALLALAGCGLSSGPPPELGINDFGEVPAFSLTDQAGATITRESFLGKVWVADFFFTSCPDVCPVLAGHMGEIQAHYADNPDLQLVSFSVDPGTDSPPVLAAYAERMHATAGRWFFLTGTIDDVRRVIVDGFKQSMDTQPATATTPATILHGSRFVVVDRRGHLRAFPDPKEPGLTTLYQQVDYVLSER